MSNLLVIKSSLHNGSGQSSQLVDEFAQTWRRANPGGRVQCRDLATEIIPHLTAEIFEGFGKPADQRNPAQISATAVSDALIAELKSADAVAIGLPMYNFTIPSTFKAWMDYVARSGVTFEYTEEGPRGLVEDKPVYIFATRGGRYQGTSNDTQTRLIQTYFGFLGMTNLHFTYAEGLAMGEQIAQQARQSARAEVMRLAA